MSSEKIVFLQLNELNFDYIERYIEKGHLPNFHTLFAEHPYVRTISETEHHLANPWIQWPTVHTGLSYADHGVFRLGDIVSTDHELIYEALEQRGISVAAFCAFNAKNNTSNPAFFVPDPWTSTRFDGAWSLKFIYDGMVQVTDDYANGKISGTAAMKLFLAALDTAKLSNIPTYLSLACDYFIRRNIWTRAIIADLLSVDAFITHWKRTRPDFATLFLNGGAHLQHHYLFSSAAYEGKRLNPEWHCPAGRDPVLEILETYDTSIRNLRRELPDCRFMVATGLHQDAHERETYYFRIDDHVSFLKDIGLEYDKTYRLMTEDFVIFFGDDQEAQSAQRKLEAVRTIEMDEIFYIETGDSAVRTDNTFDRIFHIENRGDSLYLQLRPTSKPIPKSAKVVCGNAIVEDFGTRVSFAQYKNTHHHGDGWFLDTGATALPEPMPLTNIFGHILDAFEARSSQPPLSTPEPERGQYRTSA